ncbi:hypothetical protein WDW37_00785 [Bdellovibrionota bacterium FG-1]
MAKTPETTRIAYQGSIFAIEFYVKNSGEALAETLKKEFESRSGR